MRLVTFNWGAALRYVNYRIVILEFFFCTILPILAFHAFLQEVIVFFMYFSIPKIQNF